MLHNIAFRHAWFDHERMLLMPSRVLAVVAVYAPFDVRKVY
jgi:hypothetical protein